MTRMVRLKTAEGRRWLRLDELGLWLMESEGAIDGLDALAEPIRYRSGRINDELDARGRTHTIPAGRGGDVREMIALARLRGARTYLAAGSLIDSMSTLEQAFVSGWLQEGELLLSFLYTTTPLEVPSTVGDAASCEARLVWTDRREALVALGPLGDVREDALDAPLEVEAVRGRDVIRCGDRSWKTTLFNESRYAKLVEPWQKPRDVRVRFAIEEALSAGERELAASYVGALDDPRSRLEHTLVSGVAIEHADVANTLDVIAWAERWGFDSQTRARLRDALLSNDSRSSAGLILDEWLREKHLRKEKDLDAIVQLDVEHARALVRAERHADARALLRSRLDSLTPPEAADLIPHRADAEGRPGEVQLRARAILLEALHDAGDETAQRALARLQPMREARLVALDSKPSRRALEIVRNGLRGELPAPLSSREPFDDDALRLLRHPIGRSDSFLAGIQALVARADVPDHGALKAFCARLGDPAALTIFERAVARMGVDAVAFVSQGERALGCRAYDDGEASFVVLGASHLDSEHPRWLPRASLAFAFGAELAHLRFGHSRVTASDLWSGAFDVGVSGFDLLLGAVPLVGRWKGLAEGVSKLGNAIKDGSIGSFARRAGRKLGVPMPQENEEAHLAAGQLLAAHRLMQLTADRAGLVLAGDPGAAIRAMLALHPSDAWERSESISWVELVSQRDETGNLRFPELAVRIGALLSFWLSSDYRTLSTGEEAT